MNQWHALQCQYAYQQSNVIHWHTFESPFTCTSYFKTTGYYRMEVKVIHLLDDRNRYS